MVFKYDEELPIVVGLLLIYAAVCFALSIVFQVCTYDFLQTSLTIPQKQLQSQIYSVYKSFILDTVLIKGT